MALLFFILFLFIFSVALCWLFLELVCSRCILRINLVNVYRFITNAQLASVIIHKTQSKLHKMLLPRTGQVTHFISAAHAF